jgi:hypothetical protein
MRACLTGMLALLLLPQLARADMGPFPGFSRVPRHLDIEIGSEYPGYQFWLVSGRGVEPLELVPGKPYRIDGRDRTGSHRVAWVVAASTDMAEQLQATGQWQKAAIGELPGALSSERIDFLASVPFYDSRREVVDTYRLELVPGERVSLVWVGQNAGARRVKVSWALAGAFAALGLMWVGYRLLRLMRHRSGRAEPGPPPDPAT